MAALHVGSRAAMPPAATMQREAVAALIVVAVRSMPLLVTTLVALLTVIGLPLRLTAAGDERGQTIGIAVVVRVFSTLSTRIGSAVLLASAILLMLITW